MKILSNLKNMKLNINKNNIEVIINESNRIKYNLTESSSNEILSDLIEHKAFATTFLFLNENYQLDINKDSFINESNVIDFYKDCEELLNENIKVVTEQGPLLTSIKGYPIYEIENGILRGSGKRKIFESFEDGKEKIDEFTTGKWRVVLYKVKNSSTLYDNGDLIVTFYDISQDESKFPGGQNVTTYNLDDMFDTKYGPSIENMRRLSLYGDIPAWTVEYDDLQKIAEWLKPYNQSNLNESSTSSEDTLKQLCNFLQSNNITKPEEEKEKIESYLEDNHLGMKTEVPNKIFKVMSFNKDDNAGGYIGEVSVATNGTWRYHVDDTFLNEEGTQCSDIAPKLDQNLGINKPKIVSTKINGLKENLALRGFLRNYKGQYERGNYILCLENDKYIIINKDKLKEIL